jgi:hypothetical protein
MEVGNHREEVVGFVRAFGWRFERVDREDAREVEDESVEGGARLTFESEELRRACWYGGGASTSLPLKH